MKTVMKKMFSLLLVAVLLVGAMPFQAFADDTYTVEVQFTGDKAVSHTVQVKADGSETIGGVYSWVANQYEIDTGVYTATFNWVGTNSSGTVEFATPIKENGTLTVNLVCNHTPGAAATCTTAQTCTACGIELVAATGHNYTGVVTTEPTCTDKGIKTFTCANDPSHTYTEELPATGHSFANGVCSKCNAKDPNYTPTTQEPVRKDITWQIKYTEGGSVENSGSFTPNGETAKAKDILYYHVFNKSEAWKDQYNVTKVWSSAQQADVTYAGEIAEGDTVTFVLTEKSTPAPVACSKCGEAHETSACPYCEKCLPDKIRTHSAKDHCEDCGKYGSHTSTCPKSTSYNNGSKSLTVWAKLYIGETYRETVELGTFTGLSGNELIYNIISDNRNYLESQFPEHYYIPQWTGAVYCMENATKSYNVGTSMTVNDDNNVFINLYYNEKLVVVRVHTAKSYAISSSVQVGGFQIGEVVTYDDVLKAVKKFYNVNSMKMYTYGEWEKVVAGKDAQTTPNFKVHGGDNVYEVYISGSKKASSTNYTADSSNPKTGDMIYTPVMVLGASASCLAVLFYLNKKRAY